MLASRVTAFGEKQNKTLLLLLLSSYKRPLYSLCVSEFTHSGSEVGPYCWDKELDGGFWSPLQQEVSYGDGTDLHFYRWGEQETQQAD